MGISRRMILSLLMASLTLAFPMSALAGDRVDMEVDRVVDDGAPPDSTEPVVGETDRPADRPKPDDRRDLTDRRLRDVGDRTDRCNQLLVDKHCVTDHKPVDRCLDHADNPRRCVDDHHPHDFSIRHLIWRLVKAQEWEKLVRLLIRLGLI